ncbi:Tim10/DDP family zinc finger-domain-containing protein [Phakopsora pachyrhizi]|uniref:Mitochondrial import inner membrane translocase subunit n=1 Tax=Phakopsora pachyrhizi TaxID=170000 RepID=A0AAV0AIJ9_PHAPC|nr:Tim10/DDP family zinc finger-domain-containing protein [Phakopsora pachyrhizi]
METKLDGATQKELSSFLEQEQAKARLQTSIHTFTDMCFDKCVPKAPDSRFSRSEESCLVNCVDRFLDASREDIYLFNLKDLNDNLHNF